MAQASLVDKGLGIEQGEVNATRADVSVRVLGRVHELHVDVGDTVEQGAVIARLESPQLEAALAVAEAALVTAQADLERINNTRLALNQTRGR